MSRVGLEQFFVVFLLSGFPVGLPQLFVRTVVAGEGFVGLARLNFLFRVGFAQLLCRIFASRLSCLFGFRCFFFFSGAVKSLEIM